MAKIQNLFTDFTSIYEKNTNKVVTKNSLLVLGSCCYRLNKSQDTINYSIDALEIKDAVTDVDLEYANKVADYYSKKLMLIKLNGNDLSAFRQDLVRLLHDDFLVGAQYHTPEKYTGMAFKLPYFYEYDVAMDKLFNYSKLTYKPTTGIKQLKYIFTLQTSRKHYGKMSEYWFVDKDDNKYCLEYNKENGLTSLLDNVIQKYDIVVKGLFGVRRKDYDYFVPTKYTLDIVACET